MKLKLQTGHKFMKNVVAIEGDSISFVTDRGDVMFEVIALDDGHSLEVRSGNNCKVGDKLYSNTLLVKPNVSNSIRVSTEQYDI